MIVAVHSNFCIKKIFELKSRFSKLNTKAKSEFAAALGYKPNLEVYSKVVK